jgi:hypothetical protein
MNEPKQRLQTLEPQETQLRELTAALQQAERKLREHEALVADASAQTEEARKQYAKVVDRAEALRRRLDVREQLVDSLQSQLDASTGELKAAREAIANLEKKILTLEEQFSRHADRTTIPQQPLASGTDDVLKDIEKPIAPVDPADTMESLTLMGFSLESVDQPGTIHRITKSITTIGRISSNDIVIDAKSISRHHARLVIQPEGPWLIDLRSTNGCRVNGQRITGQLLQEGDAVVIGECNFKFLVSRISLEAESQALGETLPLLDESLFLYAKPKSQLKLEISQDEVTRTDS